MGLAFGLKYAVATAAGTHIRIPLLTPIGDYSIAANWTPAAGDVKVSIDGAVQANIATLPAYVNGDWVFQLSAVELTGKKISVRIVDTAPKAILDDGFNVETFGHVNALYPTDYSVAQTVDLSPLATLANQAAIKAKTDLIPASPAAVGSPMTLAANALDAAALATSAVDEIAAAISTPLGNGSEPLNVHVESSSVPVPDCRCWVTIDEAGNTRRAEGYTDDFGDVRFNLNVGTYYLWRDHPLHSFPNPVEVEVTE